MVLKKDMFLESPKVGIAQGDEGCNFQFAIVWENCGCGCVW